MNRANSFVFCICTLIVGLAFLPAAHGDGTIIGIAIFLIVVSAIGVWGYRPTKAVREAEAKKERIEREAEEKKRREERERKRQEEERKLQEALLIEQKEQGTWPFPALEYYETCKAAGFTELSSRYCRSKAKTIAHSILEKYEVPPSKFSFYDTEDQLIEYLKSGAAIDHERRMTAHDAILTEEESEMIAHHAEAAAFSGREKRREMLQWSIEKLNTRIRDLEKEIRHIRSEFPYTMKDFLQDEAAVEEKRKQLKAQLDAVREMISQLTAYINELKAAYEKAQNG